MFFTDSQVSMPITIMVELMEVAVLENWGALVAADILMVSLVVVVTTAEVVLAMAPTLVLAESEEALENKKRPYRPEN